MKRFKIFNPGGNKTALVLENCTNEEKKVINDTILKENLEVEQVGFLNKENRVLQMAGGEFCVNATRCAIWECLNGKEGNIEINVSGYKEKIIGGITKENKVYVKLPINNNINNIIENKDKMSIIKLDGIVLLVLNEESSRDYIEALKKDEKKTKIELKEKMKETKIDEKALGIILLENENDKLKINPIIWVKEIDTVYYETACGSGSLAAAIYKNYIEGTNQIEILQPSGGIISIKLNIEKDFIKNAIIMGRVTED